MEANCWIGGIYYVGTDGAMLVNTTTPDGYKVDENGSIVFNNNSSHFTKSQISGEYQFDDGEMGGYFNGEAHYNHVYTLILNANNTFEYTYDNSFRVYDESGTYTYNETNGELTFSENPFITKGIVKDNGILISENTDGDILFTVK